MVTGDILHRNCADEKRAGILSEPLVEVEEREGEAAAEQPPQKQDQIQQKAKSRSRVREPLNITRCKVYRTFRAVFGKREPPKLRA